jgi:hypothetical protein
MSDSAAWVAVGLAIGAANLALVAALVVLLVVVRGRRSSYEEVEQLLRDSLERTEGLHGDLAAALEEARTETHDRECARAHATTASSPSWSSTSTSSRRSTTASAISPATPS